MWLKLIAVGCFAGLAAGFFGLGGGVVIIPALVFWLGFSQAKATGTTLALMLPPVGLAAAIEYYRHGNVDVRAAVILASTMLVVSWFSAHVANRLKAPYLALAFGVFLSCIGLYFTFGALKKLGWV